ncbi:MlotiK1 channel [Phocoenobacter uteri]|uniref:MlotiK1 channel n=1 Tax=Phocoenobacter uteri TaxID=146806 RepID=A0A379CCF1_9PAST|nr:ion transporter [Phocoenobacter uteri]MDG6881801.1 hypothetical protein [Phocoenobacter uteri]SUB59838.1 MlotiK1 channel [Phocoenobacter uteri]
MTSNKVNQILFNALTPSNGGRLSKIVNGIIISTILITVVSIILESEPSIRIQYSHWFYCIEIGSTLLFTLEYIARLYVIPLDKEYCHLSPFKARLKYATSFFSVIDLLAIIPFIVSFFFVDLRILRLLRLVRIFKLTRYNTAMNTLLSVIKQEANAFLSVIFILMIILVIAASGVYYFERTAQPEHFGSILKSMWWAMVTLTTVGYGDVFPITPMGKLFSSVIMVMGIGLVALPAGILASGFSDKLHKNQDQYRKAVKISLRDGKISKIERELLKDIQLKNNLSDEEAEDIERMEYQRIEEEHYKHCPHCGKSLEHQF